MIATEDGGKTWAEQTSGTTSWLRSLKFEADGQRGWVVGDSSTVIATEDGGKTWAAHAIVDARGETEPIRSSNR